MKINKVCLGANMSIPTVFSDALSYYEAILYLVGKVNEVIDEINNETNEANEYTDAQIAIVNKKIAELYRYIDTVGAGWYNELNIKITNVNTQSESRYAQLYAMLGDVVELIDITKNTLNNNIKVAIDAEQLLVATQLQQLRDYVDNAIVGKVSVFNVFRGAMTSIQQALDDYYNYMRFGALTAQEYDNLQLTAGRYDGMFIRAVVYDVGGRFWLIDDDLIFDPFTGERRTCDYVINELANLHKVALTAQEYDNKNLAAGVYDALLLTAYKYDWNGKTLIA